MKKLILLFLCIISSFPILSMQKEEDYYADKPYLFNSQSARNNRTFLSYFKNNSIFCCFAVVFNLFTSPFLHDNKRAAQNIQRTMQDQQQEINKLIQDATQAIQEKNDLHAAVIMSKITALQATINEKFAHMTEDFIKEQEKTDKIVIALQKELIKLGILLRNEKKRHRRKTNALKKKYNQRNKRTEKLKKLVRTQSLEIKKNIQITLSQESKLIEIKEQAIALKFTLDTSQKKLQTTSELQTEQLADTDEIIKQIDSLTQNITSAQEQLNKNNILIKNNQLQIGTNNNFLEALLNQLRRKPDKISKILPSEFENFFIQGATAGFRLNPLSMPEILPQISPSTPTISSAEIFGLEDKEV